MTTFDLLYLLEYEKKRNDAHPDEEEHSEDGLTIR
jgi:hypothetical protein